jgi:hypothetical protein
LIADLCPKGEDSPFMILHPGLRRSPPRWIMVFAQVAGMVDDLWRRCHAVRQSTRLRRVLPLSGRVIRLLLGPMSSNETVSGRKLADAFVRARPANPGTFTTVGAAARMLEHYPRPWADLSRQFGIQSSALWKAEALNIQASALAMTRPEMLKIQTAALGITQPEVGKFVKFAASRQVLGLPAFRLPPRYFDHLWKGSEVASFTNLIKTLDLPDFSQLVSMPVHPGLLDRLDTSLSEDGLGAPAIEAATDAILETHPELSRDAARRLFILWAYFVVASCVCYAMTIWPELIPLILAALGVAKETVPVSGKLFDKINPPEDQSG